MLLPLMMIERAWYTTRIEQLSALPDGYTRVYFGNEFCERLLPSAEDVRRCVERAGERDIPVTLLTPYVSDAGIARVSELLDAVLSLHARELEVVVNDWGVLRMMDRERLVPVLGRLLTRQERDPRIGHIKRHTGAMDDYFKSFAMDTSLAGEFLAKWNIRRMELDNVFQGIRRTGEMPASLYLPYGYLTTTRLCPFRDAARRTADIRRIDPCARECGRYTVSLSHTSMKEKILMKGNTQFFVNTEIPADLERLSIDRIVYQPELPM